MSFDPLFPIVGEKKTTKPKKAEAQRGCEVCPLDKVPGVQKIMGRIRGRKILVVGQSPGPQENDEGKELIGPAGQLWWKELRRVGIERKDCDVFNAVRCFPADVTKHSYSSDLKMRAPSNEEIRCCSIHTETELKESKAELIVVLGVLAAKALLHTRTLPASKCFWSDELKARVYLVDHPAFFLRGYGQGPRMKAFRSTLRRLSDDYKTILTGKRVSDQYSFIRKQDYRLVLNEAQATEALLTIRKWITKGRRAAVDVEDDEGKLIGVGICPKVGISFFFVLNHPENPNPDPAVRGTLQAILEDPTIEKAMHHGCTDVNKLRKLEGIRVRGFTHDTNLSEFLRFSDKKSYGLDVIAEQRLPQFSGWKLLVVREMMEAYRQQVIKDGGKLTAIFNQDEDKQAKYLSRKKLFHMSKCSLETIRLYNGADCHVTKLLEIDNKKHVPPALMRLYIDLSFILQKMETHGPMFDYEQHDKLALLYPHRVKRHLRRIRKLLGEPKFNPGSPQQVYRVLYKKLRLEYPFDDGKKPHTGKMVLLMLAREHKFPQLQMDWRADSKVKTTYLDTYERSARAHKDRLRTRWWATGARTGRLSSGGEKNKKDSTLINLQNVKKDNQIQNMCVADRRWRQVYGAITYLIEQGFDQEELERLIVGWISDNIPDLKTFLLFDYGQVEVRVATQMSGDENLIADCTSGDIHTTVGVTMTGWDADKIKNDIPTRTLTKNCIAKGQRVLTDRGLVPIEKVMKSMLVWDGVEFVSHDGVVCNGEREVLTHDGLTATPDHEVWDCFGRRAAFERAKREGVGLAVTGIEGVPVRYTLDCIEGDSSVEWVSGGVDFVYGVRATIPGECRQYSTAADYDVSVSTEPKVQRPTYIRSTGTVLCNSTEMRESEESKLAQLWGSGDRESFSVPGSICEVYAEACTSFLLQGSGDRPKGQRWPLRTGQYTTGDRHTKLQEQTEQYHCGIQGREDDGYRGSGEPEGRLSVVYASCSEGGALPRLRSSVEGVDSPEGARVIQKAKVYDILNAGPRHRFTVEGRLVSNCHFGILFGLRKENLYTFVVAMSPESMRGRITKKQVFRAFDRYFARYSKVKKFIEDQVAYGFEHNYVKTLFGMIQTINVTGGDDEELEFVGDELDTRKASWKNQCANGPVQGTAHQLMICAIVNLRRKWERYKILGVPPMEVHDALYFCVNVLDLLKAYKLGKYLLEKESLKTVTSDFPDIKWHVPIVVEAEGGLRLGAKTDIDEKTTIGGFMLNWYYKTKKQIEELDKELLSIATVG